MEKRQVKLTFYQNTVPKRAVLVEILQEPGLPTLVTVLDALEPIDRVVVLTREEWEFVSRLALEEETSFERIQQVR